MMITLCYAALAFLAFLALVVLATAFLPEIGRLLRDCRGAVQLDTFIGSDSGNGGPAGPVIDVQRAKFVRGDFTLVAGADNSNVLTATQAQGIPDGYPVLYRRRAVGGAPGWLTATYTAATRVVAIASSNAGDTSAGDWIIIVPL